jgi:membrane associated rhomboid family serine protease
MDVCYRHPDRETGVACSNCGRPICPDCMTTTPVGMRCPECAKQRTKVKTMAGVETPMLSYILIGICVALAIGAYLAGDPRLGGDELRGDFGVARFYIGEGEVWRLVTSGFLHDGPFHLMFNMFGLWILGSMLEPTVGRVRFALIYFVSLLGGSWAVVAFAPETNAVGASGAIFGLMGAAIVIMRHRGINPMESGLGLWLGLNLLITFTRPDISIAGHLGGLAAGALVAAILYELPERVRMPAVLPNVLAAAVGALAVAASLVAAA